MTCPDFDEAARRFRAFLASQGWPETVVWIRPGDVAREPDGKITVIMPLDRDNESDARALHEEGRRRNLGVSFDAVCVVGDSTYATLSYPRDAKDAELRMYPPEGGLRMGVADRRVEGQLRWPFC